MCGNLEATFLLSKNKECFQNRFKATAKRFSSTESRRPKRNVKPDRNHPDSVA
jgi:hypothetical protein